MWVYDGLLLSESIAILCASALILCAYRFRHSPSLGRLLWLGLWCGLATLARSELALAVPLLLFPLALLARQTTWRQRVTWLVAAAVLAGVVVAPWVLYNRSRFREPVMLSTNFGRTMAAAKCHGGYYGEFLGAQSYECLDRIESTPDEAGHGRVRARPGVPGRGRALPEGAPGPHRRRGRGGVGSHLRRLQADPGARATTTRSRRRAASPVG